MSFRIKPYDPMWVIRLKALYLLPFSVLVIVLFLFPLTVILAIWVGIQEAYTGFKEEFIDELCDMYRAIKKRFTSR